MKTVEVWMLRLVLPRPFSPGERGEVDTLEHWNLLETRRDSEQTSRPFSPNLVNGVPQHFLIDVSWIVYHSKGHVDEDDPTQIDTSGEQGVDLFDPTVRPGGVFY